MFEAGEKFESLGAGEFPSKNFTVVLMYILVTHT